MNSKPVRVLLLTSLFLSVIAWQGSAANAAPPFQGPSSPVFLVGEGSGITPVEAQIEAVANASEQFDAFEAIVQSQGGWVEIVFEGYTRFDYDGGLYYAEYTIFCVAYYP